MRLLLDTHVAIWAIESPNRLKAAVLRQIEDAEDVNVSVVSIWEIAIKNALGRDRHDAIGLSGEQARARFRDADFTLLPITANHAAAVDRLPPLHGDPFDRMLVAQAMSEPMHLLTRDARLPDYGTFVTLV